MTGPVKRDETVGQKAWCACGLSENIPFCDGSHARSGGSKSPLLTDINEAKTVVWCGCQKTGTPPFCDGSHKTSQNV
ncbi:MAG: CDGSH iron-sulfur domain-containing protein [Candidatus Omnitrophica bacterium]|nr:CDGSH iron-sulfur domain-containing protein [Candidatus Omnitrophota bacterium]